jgi:hypothetical protein
MKVKANYQDVPTDGAVVFSGYATGLIDRWNAAEFTSVRVRNADGASVPGQIEVQLSESEGTCCSVVLITWRPDDPFAADATYQGEIVFASVAHDNGLEPDWESTTVHTFSVETTASPPAQLTGVRIEDLQTNVRETGVQNECCVTRQGCATGASSCRYCWDSVTERSVHVSGRVEIDGGIAPWKVGFDEHYEGPDITGLRWLVDDERVHLFPTEDDEVPYCFSVEVENLMSGERSTSETVCAPAPDDTLGRVTAPRPERCIDESDADAGYADADQDDDAQTDADLGADTVDAVDTRGDRSASNGENAAGTGCSTTGRHAPNSAAVLLGLLIFDSCEETRTESDRDDLCEVEVL